MSINKTRKKTLDSFSNEEIANWFLDRRKFIKAGILAGTLSQISWLNSCNSNSSINYPSGNGVMTDEQAAILFECLNILFPNDGNGPSITEINTFDFIIWTLQDPGAGTYFNEYIIEGIDWANNQSINRTGNKFLDLSQEQKDKSFHYFIQDDYGKEWCSILMTFIIESLLLDPIYGCNINESGWKWLNITPGFPQPNELNRYENVLANARKEYPNYINEI